MRNNYFQHLKQVINFQVKQLIKQLKRTDFAACIEELFHFQVLQIKFEMYICKIVFMTGVFYLIIGLSGMENWYVRAYAQMPTIKILRVFWRFHQSCVPRGMPSPSLPVQPYLSIRNSLASKMCLVLYPNASPCFRTVLITSVCLCVCVTVCLSVSLTMKKQLENKTKPPSIIPHT